MGLTGIGTVGASAVGAGAVGEAPVPVGAVGESAAGVGAVGLTNALHAVLYASRLFSFGAIVQGWQADHHSA